MKHSSFLALALISLLALTACDTPTGDPGPGKGAASTSDWKLKGSWDWSKATNFVVEDELAPNLLTLKVTGLHAMDYEFALVDAAGKDRWLTTAATTGPYTFDAAVDKGLGKNTNAKFTSSHATYTVAVDISNPAAPVATIIAGTDAPAPFVAWSDLYVAGDGGVWEFHHATKSGADFQYIWVASGATQSFKIIPTNAWSGDIGFSGIAQGTGSLTLASDDGNIGFTSTTGNVYKAVVSFPASFLTNGKPVVTVTDITADLPYIPSNVYLTGDITATVPVTAGVATYTYTATATSAVTFNWYQEKENVGDVQSTTSLGFAAMTTDATVVTNQLAVTGDVSGNLLFTPAAIKNYWVIYDYNTVTHVPKVTVKLARQIDTSTTTTAMTNATGAGSSWGAQLGSIETAVVGEDLLVKVTWATVDSGNNLFVFLDNAGITTGATDYSLDVSTGWGNLGLAANSAAFNADMVIWGYRGGTGNYMFNYGGANTLVGSTGTDVKTVTLTKTESDGSAIYFLIPLAKLQLDATNKTLKAVVVFGKDTGSGGLHSAIPASIDTAAYADIDSVASQTLSGL